jgi:hypothetical protein
MSELYIGNATRQFLDFYYRMPESNQSRVQKIRPGGQIKISGDLTTAAIDVIVDQHKKYGLTRVSEIDRTKDFSGICYDVDRPIRVDSLRRAMDKKIDVLVAKGKEIRKLAAIANSNALETSLEESGRPEGLRELDTSIVEENPTEDSEQSVSEGIKVVADGHAPPRGRASRRKG